MGTALWQSHLRRWSNPHNDRLDAWTTLYATTTITIDFLSTRSLHAVSSDRKRNLGRHQARAGRVEGVEDTGE